MYLKIIGIVLIMMSASLMGYLFSKDYIERINRLEQIQKMLILLKGEISYSSLKDFGRGLGITDRQTQINNIEKYQSQIQLTIKELKEEKNEKCKLYRMLGITCGAFLGIVLI